MITVRSLRLLAIWLVALFLDPLLPFTAFADTTVGGTISTDTVWALSGSPYIVTSTITVKGTDGADGITTLTIEPGVTVKFNPYQRMTIGASSGDPGALVAQGEAGNPILFTSNQATPAPGDWYYIQFYNTTDDATTVLEHCTVEYGGYSSGSLYLYQASPALRNVTVQNSKSYGININTSEPTIEDCTFSANQNYDLYYSGAIGGTVNGSTLNSGISLLAIGTVSFAGNTIHQNNSFPIKAYADMVGPIVTGSSITDVDADSYLEVSAGTISHDATWTAVIPYTVIGTITVKGADGTDGITTLTIEPGVTVKFNPYQRMIIGASSGDPGALVAQGEAGNPILFTSNQATPAPGDWYYIQFYNTTDDATTVLEHCTVEYGGYSSGSLYLYQASPALRNVTVQNSKSYGININTSEPTIEDCTFSANQNYDLYYSGAIGGAVNGSSVSSGISLLASGTVSLSDNTIHQNNSFPIKAYADMVGPIVTGSSITDVDADSYLEVSAGTISHDATWTAVIPYTVIGTITVKGTDGTDGITTLTIEPGVTVKFNPYQRMIIGASSGDPGALVAQGEAGNPILFTSNQATPAPGDWYYIQFYNTTDDATTVLEHCTVEYGGYSSGMIYLYNAGPTIRNSSMLYSKSAGIYATGSETSEALIDCNTFYGNDKGIQWTASPPPEMHNNNFIGNINEGLYYTGSSSLNAENNWWGDLSGPNNAGDTFYGNVDADPWATAENQCGSGSENLPPRVPSTPVPADGGVDIPVDTIVNLSWTGGDPNTTDTVSYDLYWGGSADTLQLEVSGLTSTAYTKSGLNQGITYYWRVIAKDNQGAETPGPIWHFTTHLVLPDLVVGSISTDPAGNLQLGQTVILYATVQNIGNSTAAGGFRVDFQVAGTSVGYVDVTDAIAPGDSFQASQAWTYNGGEPELQVTVDSQYNVVEANDSNNSIVVSLNEVADNTPPVIVNTSPLDEAILYEIQQISVTLSDSQSEIDDAFVMASFMLVDSNQQALGISVSENSNTFTVVPGSLPLELGNYRVTLNAADSLGNTQTYTFSFVIEEQPPEPTDVGGVISTDTIWTLSGSPYTVTSNVTIVGTDGTDGITTLTIEPGVVVKFNSGRSLTVGASSGDPGALVARGEEGNPIRFTSNQASPAPGDWYYIQFSNTSDDATTVMEHCVVEYGGSSSGSLYTYQASPAFRNVAVRNSKSYGAYIYGSAPTFENCAFSGNQNYDLLYSGTVGGSVTGSTLNSGLSLLATATLTFSGNTINQNNSFPIKAYADMVGEIVHGNSFINVDESSYLEISAGTISQDATWTSVIPYAAVGNITVRGTDGADGITTLTIEPGVVVRFNSSRSLTIGGTSGDPGALVARGEEENPIVFTSNQASPAPGDWYYIQFSNTSDDATTVMEHCVVEYGGSSSGSVYLYNASPRIQQTAIRNSSTSGIYASGDGCSYAAIHCNTFSQNDIGVSWTGNSPPEMHLNNFVGNTSYGLYYTGSTIFNAQNNWWNRIQGPNQGGDNTYGNIDSTLWSVEEADCATMQNQPPHVPSNPSPSDGTVRVEAQNEVAFSWTGGDPNPLDAVTYDLYVGLSEASMQLEVPNLTQRSYSKTLTENGSTHYWQVVARDDKGAETPGPTWHFTTDGDPPDLIVSQVTTVPAGNLQPGQNISITATCQNNGTGPVVDSFEVSLFVDSILVASEPFSGVLLSGGSTQVEWSWTYPGGDPSLEIVVDSTESVAETNEENNRYFALMSEISDNASPLLIGSSPSDGSYLQQIQLISITLSDSQSAVDDAAVLSSFVLTDSNSQEIGGTKSESNDTFTFVPDSTPLSDGTYTASLTAVDTFGNSNAVSISFAIDTQPPGKPVITGEVVASGTLQCRPASNNSLDFTVQVEGTREVSTSVWINNSKKMDEGSDAWSVPLVLLPGDNVLEIWLVDLAGNRGLSEWLDIHVDSGTEINYRYNSSGRVKRIDSE